MGAAGAGSARRFFRSKLDRYSVVAAFSPAASIAGNSWSTPRTGTQPSFAATIASTAEPVPRSTRAPPALPLIGELDQELHAHARRRVGAGAERLPGIDHNVKRVGLGVARQSGRITTRPPARTVGSWKSRQRSAQSSGIFSEVISTRSSPAAASTSPRSGSSPSAP